MDVQSPEAPRSDLLQDLAESVKPAHGSGVRRNLRDQGSSEFLRFLCMDTRRAEHRFQELEQHFQALTETLNLRMDGMGARLQALQRDVDELMLQAGVPDSAQEPQRPVLGPGRAFQH